MSEREWSVRVWGGERKGCESVSERERKWGKEVRDWGVSERGKSGAGESGV